VAILAERVTPPIRSTDVVTCWDPPCLALMLIDADVASLPSIVDRLTTRLEMYLGARVAPPIRKPPRGPTTSSTRHYI